jgi:hypothetical protein
MEIIKKIKLDPSPSNMTLNIRPINNIVSSMVG